MNWILDVRHNVELKKIFVNYGSGDYGLVNNQTVEHMFPQPGTII